MILFRKKSQPQTEQPEPELVAWPAAPRTEMELTLMRLEQARAACETLDNEMRSWPNRREVAGTEFRQALEAYNKLNDKAGS